MVKVCFKSLLLFTAPDWSPLLLGDQGSLPRLRDMADTFHFASSTSSEDDCVSQRHTRGHLTELQACSTDTLSTSRAPLPPSCRCLDPGPLAHQQIQHGVCCHRHVQTPHTLCFGEIWTLTAQQLAPGTWAVTSAALQPPAWSSSLTSLTLAPNSCFFRPHTLFLPQELHWVPYLLQLVSLRLHWLQLLTPTAQGTCTPIWLQCLAPNPLTPPPATGTSSLKHSYAHRTANEVVHGKLPQDLRRWARLQWGGAGLVQTSLLTSHGLHTTAPSCTQPCSPLTPLLLFIPYELPCKFCKVSLTPPPLPPRKYLGHGALRLYQWQSLKFLNGTSVGGTKEDCLHYLSSTGLFLFIISSVPSLLVISLFIEKALDEVTLLEQRLSSAMCPCGSNTAETSEM